LHRGRLRTAIRGCDCDALFARRLTRPIASSSSDVRITATTLRDRIAEFMQNMAKHAPPEVVTTLAAEIRKLAESGIANRTIAVGARAPDFSLPDARGGKVSLSTLVQTGPTVVTFYRGGWCPFCDLQLRA
jgi:hypothetical protein